MNQSLPLEGVWVLVVEDQADTAEIITLILEDVGAQVIAVGSAEEALKIGECFIPDVLVSDIQLPDLNGHLLLQRLREQMQLWRPDSHIQLPAIALTGQSTPFSDFESQQQANQAGFQKYLPKPFEIEDLINSVAELNRMSAGRTSAS